MVSDESLPVEFVFELPELLKGPVKLPDGQLVDIGDKVEHQSLGVGRVLRISTYHDDLGILLFVEFPNFQHELLCLDGVKKVIS